MLPDSEEYAKARELCRRISAGQVPSGFEDQTALMRAMAIMLPDALDTIVQLVRINLELRIGVKRVAASVAATSQKLGADFT
jgi:hypothetical protein